MVLPATHKVPEDDLLSDLERYRKRSIELGATDSKVITTDMIVIDERVLAKCNYPKCTGFGTNINCPPYAMSLDQVRKVVSKFRYGIFINLRVPSGDIAGPEARDMKLVHPYRTKLAEITARIEADAFYDGHYLAVGFGNGSCKSLFCPETDCRALVAGQACPHRLKARSPMEAVGMDCFAMAKNAGWEIYAIGRATSPSEVPYGLRLSLVLID